jgi:hypothetical protein
MEDKKQGSGFVIKDKRHFGESAEEQKQEETKTAGAEEKTKRPGAD